MVAQHNRTRVAFERITHLSIDGPPDSLLAVDTLDLDALIEPAGSFATMPAFERLEARGLSHHHDAAGSGISDVDFTIERGSFTVITGRIGAGKTTLLKALLGLLPHQQGDIRWNGQPVASPTTFFVPPRSA